MQYKYDIKTHTAYNEAGHTVAYYYFGIPVTSVTIIPDKDGNDGLTVNKAFLTFTAAQAAASGGDVVWCFDNGTYTENTTTQY